MDLKSFKDLFTDLGQAALAEAINLVPLEADYLGHFQALSRRFPATLAQAALEIAIQRGKAVAKFPFAGKVYFSREALEQASSYPVAAYRAQRFAEYRTVFDLGCGAGGDAVALAERGPVVGVDRDPLRLAMAHANLDALGLGDRGAFVQADLHQPPFDRVSLSSAQAAFCDPSRREDERRVYSVERYSPPLSVVAGWRNAFPALGVKLSPGVDLAELRSYDAEVEFISLDGELKECVLWFGPLRSTGFRATLIDTANDSVHSLTKAPDDPSLPPNLSAPRSFLSEPDPAVLRAGLVRELGERLGAAQIDSEIAYLTSDVRVETPFARCWGVADWFPFNLKRLRAYLRDRNVGRVTIKKRGSPLEPGALARQLKLKGENHALLFVTQYEGQHIVIVAEE